MKFWDSSALVTLLVQQPKSAAIRQILAEDRQVLAWTLSDVEIRSALCRLEREGAMTTTDFALACQRQATLWGAIHAVQLTSPIVEQAKRLLAVHSLRAADSLQLAAALAATYGQPVGHEMVCLDRRLSDAAMREGFTILP